jgi:pre-mRNA-splicing factor CWC26
MDTVKKQTTTAAASTATFEEKPKEKRSKAGLYTADQFVAEQERIARAKDMLQGADPSQMGANAETVYRDKRGRKMDMLNEMIRQQEILEGKRKRKAKEEYEWGT